MPQTVCSKCSPKPEVERCSCWAARWIVAERERSPGSNDHVQFSSASATRLAPLRATKVRVVSKTPMQQESARRLGVERYSCWAAEMGVFSASDHRQRRSRSNCDASAWAVVHWYRGADAAWVGSSGKELKSASACWQSQTSIAGTPQGTVVAGQKNSIDYHCSQCQNLSPLAALNSSLAGLPTDGKLRQNDRFLSLCTSFP